MRSNGSAYVDLVQLLLTFLFVNPLAKHPARQSPEKEKTNDFTSMVAGGWEGSWLWFCPPVCVGCIRGLQHWPLWSGNSTMRLCRGCPTASDLTLAIQKGKAPRRTPAPTTPALLKTNPPERPRHGPQPKQMSCGSPSKDQGLEASHVSDFSVYLKPPIQYGHHQNLTDFPSHPLWDQVVTYWMKKGV